MSKKAITGRCLQYIQGRIRRDGEWARSVKILGGTVQEGPGIEFSDLWGHKRTYSWNSNNMLLTLPVIDRNDSVEVYKECKFRLVDVYLTEGGGEGLRTILSPLPMDENEAISGAKEELWGVACVGRVELDCRSIADRFALFNEPAYRPANASQ